MCMDSRVSSDPLVKACSSPGAAGPPAGQARGCPTSPSAETKAIPNCTHWAENTACFHCFLVDTQLSPGEVLKVRAAQTEPTRASAGTSPETAVASEGLERAPCLATCQRVRGGVGGATGHLWASSDFPAQAAQPDLPAWEL